jgi:glycosyltransferase involved in cell wall biosynthesis
LSSTGVPESLITIIPNAVHPLFRIDPAEPRNNVHHTFRIISNGRLITWKGHRYLIEALARLIHQENIDAELTLIGEGELKAELHALACALHVQDRIHFAGRMEQQDIATLFRQHDLYVQPSIIDIRSGQCEAFGIAVLEAACCGLPVVVTDTGGLPDLVGPPRPAVRIVPQKDPAALCKAMLEIRTLRPEERLDAAYAEMMAENFSQKKQTAAFESLYNEMLWN